MMKRGNDMGLFSTDDSSFVYRPPTARESIELELKMMRSLIDHHRTELYQMQSVYDKLHESSARIIKLFDSMSEEKAQRQ